MIGQIIGACLANQTTGELGRVLSYVQPGAGLRAWIFLVEIVSPSSRTPDPRKRGTMRSWALAIDGEIDQLEFVPEST